MSLTTLRRRISMGRVATIGVLAAVMVTVAACGSSEQTQATNTVSAPQEYNGSNSGEFTRPDGTYYCGEGRETDVVTVGKSNRRGNNMGVSAVWEDTQDPQVSRVVFEYIGGGAHIVAYILSNNSGENMLAFPSRQQPAFAVLAPTSQLTEPATGLTACLRQ